MKNRYILFIVFVCHSLNAQVINFPDLNLKAKLLEADVTNEIASNLKIDVNDNGEIEVSEVQEIQALNISNSSISDLTGLNFFSLIGLDCSYNSLTNLEGLNQQSLEVLKCDHNQLTELLITTTTLVDINCSYNQLITLDLSMLPFTDSIEIQNNNLSQFYAPNYVGNLNIRNNNFNSFNVPAFTTIGSNFFFGNNPSDTLIYNGSWRTPMQLHYSSDTATVVDLSNVPMFTYELDHSQPDYYFSNCTALESIKLNNGLISGPNFFEGGRIDIQNCSSLSLICADSGEEDYFNQRLVELGLSTQVQVSIECQLSSPNFEIQKVVLFPNPVKNTLNIKLTHPSIINEINIYNSIGQLVLTSIHNDSIDVSALTAGTYLIKVHSDNQLVTEKFIKQ